MSEKSCEFKEINYVECAELLNKFPSRQPIFYFNGDELNQIKTPTEFINVIASELKVYLQV